ncbi:MAG: methyl-accepting chemotaxis protein [bacterium]|nr:methyl-accepting chemotaxis protein [bacterium]
MRVINNLRIGTKLAITSGLAIALVAAMILLQISGGAKIREAVSSAERQASIVQYALDAKASARGMQAAVRDVLLASTQAELQEAVDNFSKRVASALKYQSDMAKLSPTGENGERIKGFATLIASFRKGSEEIAAIRKLTIERTRQGGDQAGEVSRLNQEVSRIRTETTKPLGEQMEKLADSIVEFAKARSAEQRIASDAEMSWIERLSLSVGIAVALLLAGTALFSVFTIARPIRTIAGSMGKLAAGDYDVAIQGAERGDEVGDVAKTAAVFKENGLAKIRMEAEQKEAERNAAVVRRQDMIRLADQFEGAVGEIIETVSSASTELEASAGTLTSTAERSQELTTMVAAASEEASTNVRSVASATEELSSSVTEISRQVQESARMAGEAVDQARTTNDRVGELSKAAARIGDVVELINTIAGQTNLLALNATIEAARAGEAGRGFAVVASEVKALAEQTAKATGEIGQQISGIQAATQESVGAIREISGTIERLSEISSTIAAAVEEQGAATQEISRNVQQAAQGTQQVSSNITDVQRGASETGSASSQVLSAAQSLSSDSNRLKLEVGKFLDTVRAA